MCEYRDIFIGLSKHSHTKHAVNTEEDMEAVRQHWMEPDIDVIPFPCILVMMGSVYNSRKVNR